LAFGRFASLRTVFSSLAIIAAVTVLAGCQTMSGSAKAEGTLSGYVASEPVEGAYIFIYESGADPHGPPYAMTEATTAAGVFEIELPDGEYTLVARRHMSGLAGSPLSEGDLKSQPVNVRVVDGKVEPVTLFVLKKDDQNVHFGASEETKTAISGMVLDSEGNPMRGFRVHVYTYAQMSERPKYVSAATGPDGRYVVYLPKGGTYYLAARDHFGGPPKIGDYYGRYDEGTIDPSGVIVPTGDTLEDVNITVHKIW